MQLFIDSPHPTSRVQQFLDAIDKISVVRGKSVPPIVNIEKLRSLPPGSFGKAWADFLDTNNLQPFTTGARRKQLHDGVHVITGYGTDPIGEAEVQAFLLGAKFHFMHVALGLGLLRIISKHHQYRQNFSWNRLYCAYQRGLHSHFNPDTWQPEHLWHLPLAEVQCIFLVNSQ
ncbi:MAG: Coq4 family protein [Nostocaceae cyanobacterium]|nr:Coq4 family protein [Nostocaceae cyanobacterium]